MPENIKCPRCGNDRAYVHKKPNHQSKHTHYKCTNCKRVWSESGLPRGTQPKFKDRALTPRELSLRHRPLSVHYQVPDKPKSYTACGSISTRSKSRISSDCDKVTCQLCKRTNIYKQCR